MKRILLALQLALIGTAYFPLYATQCFKIYDPSYSCNPSLRDSPLRSLPYPLALTLQETWNPSPSRPIYSSITIRMLTPLLALLNLPAVLMLRAARGARWRAVSSMLLGLLSSLMILAFRCAYDYVWGGTTILITSCLLWIAGTAATARLRPDRDLAPSVVDS